MHEEFQFQVGLQRDRQNHWRKRRLRATTSDSRRVKIQSAASSKIKEVVELTRTNFSKSEKGAARRAYLEEQKCTWKQYKRSDHATFAKRKSRKRVAGRSGRSECQYKARFTSLIRAFWESRWLPNNRRKLSALICEKEARLGLK